MAEEKQEEEGKIPVELASNIVQLTEFLDPHLPAASEADKPLPKRWSWHLAGVFIIGTSLMLWGAIFAIVHYAYRFLALRGRH
jgi:hypothetical protein